MFGLHFSSVFGIPNPYNGQDVLQFKNLFESDDAKQAPVKAWLFNYMIDVEWVLNELPVAWQRSQLVMVGHKGNIAGLTEHKASNVTTVEISPAIPFGTHHSKMLFIQFSRGLRVVILTANFIAQDWYQKTQGIWQSPLLQPLGDNGNNSSEGFYHDLCRYLKEYKKREMLSLVDVLSKYDFGPIKVHFVGSAPGRRTGLALRHFGLPRVQQVLNQHKDEFGGADGRSYQLIAQFSSIGSIGSDPSKWLESQFARMLRPSPAAAIGDPAEASQVKLVFPTVESVRNSLEGYEAGSSLPYSLATHQKQEFIRNYMYEWVSDFNGRTRASPHVKSYALVSSSRARRNDHQAHWYILTSANLSKAAWGSFEKGGTQYFIRSFEAGVLLLPCDFGFDHFKIGFGSGKLRLPYDLPLKKYKDGDEPWTWDKRYTKLDSHGNTWPQ